MPHNSDIHRGGSQILPTVGTARQQIPLALHQPFSCAPLQLADGRSRLLQLAVERSSSCTWRRRSWRCRLWRRRAPLLLLLLLRRPRPLRLGVLLLRRSCALCLRKHSIFGNDVQELCCHTIELCWRCREFGRSLRQNFTRGNIVYGKSIQACTRAARAAGSCCSSSGSACRIMATMCGASSGSSAAGPAALPCLSSPPPAARTVENSISDATQSL